MHPLVHFLAQQQRAGIHLGVHQVSLGLHLVQPGEEPGDRHHMRPDALRPPPAARGRPHHAARPEDRHDFVGDARARRPGQHSGHRIGPESGFLEQFAPCGRLQRFRLAAGDIPGQTRRPFHDRCADRLAPLRHQHQAAEPRRPHDHHDARNLRPLHELPAVANHQSQVLACGQLPGFRWNLMDHTRDDTLNRPPEESRNASRGPAAPGRGLQPLRKTSSRKNRTNSRCAARSRTW